MRYLTMGALFGFILSRAGATDYRAIQGMFTLEDPHLLGVIGVAIVVAALGFTGLRRRGIACAAGCDVTLAKKPVKPGLVVGSLIFGAGWALTGTCPGTGLAQVGEGRLIAVFTVFGIVAGAALHRVAGPSLERRLSAARRWLRPPRRSPRPEDAVAARAS